MLSLGALIWTSVRPLIRLIICTSFGFIITKADIFPLAASRGAGQIMLNITLPSLMFSKIVPAFTPENISALGPLVTVALIYEALGFFMAWLVKRFFWVPHRFRYGILCAGTFGNYSDVPTSVIMSITGGLPFNGTTDQGLSVAYISAFILIFFLTLFPLGGHRLVEMDYVGPDVEDEDVRMSMIAKSKQNLLLVRNLIRYIRGSEKVKEVKEVKQAPPIDLEKCPSKNSEIEADVKDIVESPIPDMSYGLSTPAKERVTFFASDSTAVPTEVSPSPDCSVNVSRVVSPAPSEYHADSPTLSPSRAGESIKPKGSAASPQTRPALRRRILTTLRSALRSLFMPPSLTIIFAFIIAIITPLKALFTPVPNSPIPNAPDGQPPLAFILDTATFVGGASIPIGLICLGSAIARIQIPRGAWHTLPIGAISWLAILKMLVMPVLGVLIVEGLVSVGFIDANDKVLRFVCVFFSCVPTATTQVFLTQVYSGTGSAEPLPAFLIPQYILMFFSMTILTAYTLSMLF